MDMKEFENMKEKFKSIAYSRAKRFHQGNNHWHVNKRSSVIVCKFCETKIPIWENPEFCPVCLDGRETN